MRSVQPFRNAKNPPKTIVSHVPADGSISLLRAAILTGDERPLPLCGRPVMPRIVRS